VVKKKSSPTAPLHFHGHRQRIRARFTQQGIDAWQDYEILELLLTYCIPQKDTKIIAKTLIERFKSLPGVLDASGEDLTSITGISQNGAVLLKLTKSITGRYLKSPLYQRETIATPQAVADYLSATLRGNTHEELHVLFLDNGNRLIAAECIHRGTVNHSTVYPRTILERALHHHAAAVIIAHNHPGGTCQPSSADIQTTMAVRRALETIDISLLDHLIITDTITFSFKQKDLL